MAWYRAGGGGGGVPASLKSDMNAVFNKKFGTSTDYPPTGWPDDVNIMGPLPKGKSSGSIAHITDGADDVPCSSCVVKIAPTLTGVSSVDVTRYSGNFADISGTDTANGYVAGQFLKNDGSTSSNGNWNISEYIVIPSNLEMTLSWLSANNLPSICFYDASKTFISGESYGGSTKITFTTPSTAKYCRLSYDSSLATSLMLEQGATESPYVTPHADTYTASLGQTIYGGSVDVVNGTGTKTCSLLTALNSLTWSKTTISGHDAFYANLPNGYIGQGSGILDGDCDTYAITTDTNLGTDRTIRLYYNENFNISRCVIRDDQYASYTGAQFKEAVTGNIVYQLAESAQTDFTFTPVEIPTMYGVNNFFSNLGDTELEYRKDINLAIGLNKYRYLRWKISATRTTSSYCQMSDIEFSDANGNTFTFPTGTTVTASTSATSGSSPAYIVDGNTATKFCGNWVTGGITLNIDLGMGNVIDVSVYKNFSWYTANDATDRDPKTWELYGIDNANNEILLCSRTDFTPTTERKALADTVTITPLE